MASTKTPATRRRHTNSKLGCLNCKRKKIRCDENLPQCENCLRAKRESCSYLELTQAEINRIRLTHSLRNSQNKLLLSDYRLPISTSHFFGDNSSAKAERTSAPANTLEFQFEYCHFDKPFPAVPYAAFQFHNTFMDAYANGYASDDDYRSPSTGDDGKVSAQGPPRGLPNCKVAETAFQRLDIDQQMLQLLTRSQTLKLMLFFRHFKGNKPFSDLFVDSHVVLGRTIILHRMRQRLQLNANYLQHLVSVGESRACHDCSLLMTSLQKYMKVHKQCVQLDTPVHELFFQNTVLSHLSWHCTAALMFLNFPRYLIIQAISERCDIFSKFMRKASETALKDHIMIKELSRYVRHSLLYIHIPLYEPAFLFEMRNNLRTLEYIFDYRALPFLDARSQKTIRKLNFYYQNLISFMDNFVLNVAYTSRNELFVTTYPPLMIFSALQRWWSICPTELLSGGPYRKNSGFVSDLRNTLFLYFDALSISLDSVWPAAKYLFTMGFEWVPQRERDDETSFMPNLDLYRTDFVLPDRHLANFLWRHDIFAMRLTAFFRTRLKLYQDNTTYRCPYSDNLPNSQLGPRMIKNALELPIRSFNTLVIKPHHYAKKIHSHYDSLLKDSSVCAIYTRDDDLRQETHVPDPFNLFSLATPVDFSESTRFCQQDYVPELLADGNTEGVDALVLRRYFEDRIAMLADVH